MRTVLLLLSVLLNVWMGLAIIRLENYHYVVQTGCVAMGQDYGNRGRLQAGMPV